MAKTLFLSPKHLHLQSSLPFSLFPSSTSSSLPISLFHPKRSNLSFTPIPSNFRNGSTPPGTECPVPADQQPINEYQNLSASFPFSWASGDAVEYSSRLFVTGLSVGLLVGLPVTWFGSIGSDPDPIKLILGSVCSGLFAVTLAVVRMYLGWAYVGNRLLSATVGYEETGWYDGQVWVKTPEILARDRLLGSFQVKPVLSRLKDSLVALAVSLLLSVSVLVNYDANQKELKELRRYNEDSDRVVPGVYNDDSARSFEPDAFCGDSGLAAD